MSSNKSFIKQLNSKTSSARVSDTDTLVEVLNKHAEIAAIYGLNTVYLDSMNTGTDRMTGNLRNTNSYAVFYRGNVDHTYLRSELEMLGFNVTTEAYDGEFKVVKFSW